VVLFRSLDSSAGFLSLSLLALSCPRPSVLVLVLSSQPWLICCTEGPSPSNWREGECNPSIRAPSPVDADSARLDDDMQRRFLPVTKHGGVRSLA
jgi:hypothetical protein